MFKLNLTHLTPTQFLQEYWQKKPLLIKQGFLNFQDPLSPDELAGIACENKVQSRLIRHHNGQWHADFGPFESYDHLGESHWSLVVQALNHWSEDAAKIIEAFQFIPHWRLDDLMASFATPQGSVGPHIDQYDTFICQGSGNRHWRVGQKGPHKEFSAHPHLRHVEQFEPIIDEELSAGDILYIPPGFPHEGISLNHSMSFSVGFRTHSSVSLLSAFADFLIDQDLGHALLEDPDRTATQHSGAIDRQDYQRIKQHLCQILDDEPIFRQFTGSYMTQAKHELDLIPVDDYLLDKDISDQLSQKSLLRLGGLRAFYFTDTLEQGLCYINGEEVRLATTLVPIIKLLCDHAEITPDMSANFIDNLEFIHFVKAQIQLGHWYFSD